MTTSVGTFRNEFTEGVLNFVWHQWCRLGVAGSAGQKDPSIIDPEPVLGFTIEDDKGHVAEAYLPVFLRDADGILKALAG